MRRVSPVLVVLRATALTLLLAVIFAPIYWALKTSLTRPPDIARTPVQYFPAPPQLTSWGNVLEHKLFMRSLMNSLITAGGATLLAIGIGALAACALGRYRFPGRRPMLYILLSMTMFPQIAVVGSLYHLAQRTGLYNTLGGLMASHLLITLPFTVWVLTTFFRALPRELEESAYVDGASPLQTFLRILLPLAAPGLATTGLLAFISSWNEYLFALSLTFDAKARTAPVVIAQFSGAVQYETPWGEIMAASLMATAPLVVVALLFQRLIVSGLTAGSVKG